MKKSAVVLSAMLLVFGALGTASGSLIDLGNGVTQDDRGTLTPYDDQYWLRNIGAFSGMTYSEQITAIANVNIPSLTNITSWHMATYSDILNLWDSYTFQEIGGAFEPTSEVRAVTINDGEIIRIVEG